MEWLQAQDAPRAIYATTDEQAHGVLFAAYSLGVSVPNQLAVISVDGTEASAYSVPPLSTIRQPTQSIAERAVGLLVDGNPEESLVKEIFDFELIIRRSSRI